MAHPAPEGPESANLSFPNVVHIHRVWAALAGAPHPPPPHRPPWPGGDGAAGGLVGRRGGRDGGAGAPGAAAPVRPAVTRHLWSECLQTVERNGKRQKWGGNGGVQVLARGNTWPSVPQEMSFLFLPSLCPHYPPPPSSLSSAFSFLPLDLCGLFSCTVSILYFMSPHIRHLAQMHHHPDSCAHQIMLWTKKVSVHLNIFFQITQHKDSRITFPGCQELLSFALLLSFLKPVEQLSVQKMEPPDGPKEAEKTKSQTPML